MENKEISLKKIIIDLSKPSGNDFALLGHARKLANMFGKNDEKILHEMRKANSKVMVKILEREFGDHVLILNK